MAELGADFWNNWNSSIGDEAGVKGGEPGFLDGLFGGGKSDMWMAAIPSMMQAAGSLLGKGGGGGAGGGVNVAQTTSNNIAVNPNIVVAVGGSPGTTSGGNASGSASANASMPSYLPQQSSYYGGTSVPVGTYGDIGAVRAPTGGGILDVLLDPMVLMAAGAAVLFYMYAGKK